MVPETSPPLTLDLVNLVLATRQKFGSKKRPRAREDDAQGDINKYCQGLKTRYCRVGLFKTAQPVKILALDTFCRSLNKQNKVWLFF